MLRTYSVKVVKAFVKRVEKESKSKTVKANMLKVLKEIK